MPRRRIPVLPIALMVILAPFWPLAGPAAAIDITCPPPTAATAASDATPASSTPAAVMLPEDDVDLTVFAAASLTDAYAEIGDLIEERYPNITITIETGGSQTLVTQLGEGARADVLATANISTMRQAQEEGLIEDEPVLFTGNRLVIVTPPDNPAGIDGIDDLTGDDIRLVIAAEDVPAGQYARQAICDWSGEGTETLTAIGDNVVSEEVDVRSALTKVLLGEADAAIVYASDAAAADLAGTPVNVIDFPDDVPTAAAYPIAPIVGGNTEAAQAFIGFVLSEEGQQILERYGFLPVG